MNIKEIIKREASMREATTVRFGEKNFNIPKNIMYKMKSIMTVAIEKISNELRNVLNKKLSEKELDKQAETFIKNYLKGVYKK